MIPPYWRAFLYLLVDIGLFWQLLQMWSTNDALQRSRNALGALIMTMIGAVQGLVAIGFYFMAKTEMFLSPLTQGFTYAAMRPFIGNLAKDFEDTAKTVIPVNPEYWNFHTLLDPATIKNNRGASG